jgi:hypothetical protein
MWLARIACTGAECDEELEVVVEELDDLDRLACRCGYGFVLISLGEAELVTP